MGIWSASVFGKIGLNHFFKSLFSLSLAFNVMTKCYIGLLDLSRCR